LRSPLRVPETVRRASGEAGPRTPPPGGTVLSLRALRAAQVAGVRRRTHVKTETRLAFSGSKLTAVLAEPLVRRPGEFCDAVLSKGSGSGGGLGRLVACDAGHQHSRGHQPKG